MSMETLSLVIIFCDGIFIVIVLRVTRVICSTTGIRKIKPGPRTPVTFPKKNTTPLSYSLTTRKAWEMRMRTMAKAIIKIVIGRVYPIMKV